MWEYICKGLICNAFALSVMMESDARLYEEDFMRQLVDNEVRINISYNS